MSRNVERKNSKSVLAEFDLKRKKYTEYKLTSLKEGYFRINEDREELASVRIDGCKAGGNAAVLLNENEIPSSPVALDKNLYAAIIKDGLKWKIRLFDSKKVVAEYDLQGKILHKLHLASAGDDSILLSFTWAELGKGGQMLSRAGFLKIDRKSLNAQAFFQKENLFAGLLEVLPSKKAAEVFCRADETESESSFLIFAVAAEYDKKPLYRIEMKNSVFEKTEIISGI